ncbi:MAG: nicotinate (nicotinamide) nucleotide adenylyltransferase, partial [candidate division Zixibacteria bacterium]|nr:nicotinate (nicotinamide) nucleotide adenylyltransferase [candidate division Zixibacteria bacterium]
MNRDSSASLGTSKPLGVNKIGLLGGTFDPPHLAHLVLAQSALDELKLDEIWFIPVFRPPHKQGEKVSPFQHRLHMLRLAIRGNRRFKVLTIEKEKGGLSYTVETLPPLRQKHPNTQFFLLLGADNLAELSSWKEPEKVFSMAQPVFAHRPRADSSTMLETKEKVPVWLEHAVWLSNPLLEISASDLRKRIQAGRSIRYLVPEAVERYIRK